MLAWLATAAVTTAIVADDRVALRAAPAEGAPRQEVLYRGDWLEVRGEHAGFLQVYHHRTERPGYVRTTLVRTHLLDERSGPALGAVVSFLRDAPGQESLGIAYAALWLKVAARAARPQEMTTIQHALGTMADRLARRASAAQAGPSDAVLPGQLAVAEGYGVHFLRFATDGDKTRTCYDGEAFRHALGSADAGERAEAALGLTRPECARPDAGAVELASWNAWRSEVLGRAESAGSARRPQLLNRLQMRRAEVESWRAFQHARRGDRDGARTAAAEALRRLALVDRSELAPDDVATYEETAVRVGAVRGAAEPQRSAVPLRPGGALSLEARPGERGQTCLRLIEGGGGDGAGKAKVAFERCTFALVWTGSAHTSPGGEVVTVPVQPLPGWSELWVLRKLPGVPAAKGGADKPGWTVDVLPPAPRQPDAGYVELAGFAPDGSRLLVTREALGEAGSGARRSFQVLRADTLAVEQEVHGSPEQLVAFRRWASPGWRGRSVALR